MTADQPNSTPGYLLNVRWPATIVGGVNEVVLSLASQLRLKGYSPVISASRPEPEPVRGTEVVALGIDPPMTAEHYWRPLLGFILRFPLVGYRLFKFLNERGVRIVNAHYPDLDMLYFLILQKIRLYRGRILLSFHGADVHALHQTRGFYRSVWRFLITNVDGNTACSEALRQSLLSFAPSAKVTAIHNGSDVELFRVTERPPRPRRTVLQVGKFEAKKGQDVLLRAMQLLRQTTPDLKLILVGADGSALAVIRNLIIELKLEDCTEVHVNVPHELMPDLMRRADIFVLPSRVEPFGIVLLEAGASLLPVVATRVGGIPELLNHDVTGLLVEPDDVSGLGNAIRTLILDEDKAMQLARRWYEEATTQWTWERTCRDYLSVGDPLQLERSFPSSHGS